MRVLRTLSFKSSEVIDLLWLVKKDKPHLKPLETIISETDTVLLIESGSQEPLKAPLHIKFWRIFVQKKRHAVALFPVSCFCETVTILIPAQKKRQVQV